MLHWMILLVLLVGNSLAFGIYEDIDDNHLWRRGGPSVHTTASSGEEKICKKDILVIWDNSISIGETRFKDNVIPFLLGFINSKKLKVEEDGTHLGFISFSTKRRTETILEIGTKNTVEELTAWLKGLKYSDYSGRRTFTGSAFKLANETFSQRSPLNHRPEAEDVILLFTDGAPNARKRKTLNEQIELADKCSKSLMNDKDIKIVSLAVGNWQKFVPAIEKWSSEDSVYTAGLDDLDKVLDKTVKGTCAPPPVRCQCKGTTEVRSYVGPGEDSVALKWLKPTAVTKNSIDCKLVDEPVQKNGSSFSQGIHKLKYIFGNKESEQILCPVIIDVTRCSCPTTQTIRRTVEAGRTTVDVSWEKPEPNCTTSSSNNPGTSGSFPVGEYVRTYKYTINQGKPGSFEFQCHVNITIRGYCGKSVYDTAKQECCCGKIRKKIPGYQCCGSRYYNPITQDCCDESTGIILKYGKCP